MYLHCPIAQFERSRGVPCQDHKFRLGAALIRRWALRDLSDSKKFFPDCQNLKEYTYELYSEKPLAPLRTEALEKRRLADLNSKSKGGIGDFSGTFAIAILLSEIVSLAVLTELITNILDYLKGVSMTGILLRTFATNLLERGNKVWGTTLLGRTSSVN